MMRKSKDGVINKVGKELIQIGETLELNIINGTTIGDRDGEYTFIAPVGESIVDYIIMLEESFEFVEDFQVGEHEYSDHLPYMLKLKLKCGMEGSENQGRNEKRIGAEKRKKYIWKQNEAENFIRKLVHSISVEKMHEILKTLENNTVENSEIEIQKWLTYLWENLKMTEKKEQ